MREVHVFLTLVTVGSCIKYDGLIVKFGWSDALADVKYFFSIPRTIHEAEGEGWRRTERPKGPLKELRMYCPPGRMVCPLYDTAGFVAGLQIGPEIFESSIGALAALVRLYFEGAIDAYTRANYSALHLDCEFPVESIPPELKPERYFEKWSAPAGEGEPPAEYYVASQYYVTEDSLKAGAGPTAENGATLQDSGVWVKGVDGKMLKIPTSETELQATLFKKQNCVPNMGIHYYYNVSQQFDCDLIYLPWFALVTKGEVLGVSFQTPGKRPFFNKFRDWFEEFPSSRRAPLMAMPHAPECMLERHEKYGFISLHIYYIKKPWDIKCETGDSVEPAPVMDRLALSGVRYANKIGDEFKKMFDG